MDGPELDKMKLRKYSSSQEETEASWEGETLLSSHDSGFSSGTSCGWPNTVTLSGQDEEFFQGLASNVRTDGEVKPDLLDSLILEDIEEQFQLMGNMGYMVSDGPNSSKLNLMRNLLMLLELQGEEGTGETHRAGSFEGPEDGGGVAQTSFMTSSNVMEDGRGTAKDPVSMQSLENFMEQEVPLAFPGQQAPVSARPAKTRSSQCSGGGERKGRGQGEVSPEVLGRMGEVARQLNALARERRGCEKMLANHDLSLAITVQQGRTSDRAKPDKLLADLRKEHQRMLELLRRLELTGLKSQSLRDSLAVWQGLIKNVANVVRHGVVGTRDRRGQEGLATEMVSVGRSMRRVRTLLWSLMLQIS